MYRRISLYIVIFFILIALVAGLAYLIRGNMIDTTSLLVAEINIKDNKLHITGTTLNSAQAFSGYDYAVRNDSLYLSIRYALVNPFHKNGDFDITIDDNLNGIKKIYLQGREMRDLLLVWNVR